MKLKEAYELAAGNAARFQRALSASIRGEVVWTNSAEASTLWGGPTDPKTTIRLGLIDAPEPLVIVDYIDRKEVAVLHPYTVAQWSWPTVESFLGLAGFLRRHLDVDGLEWESATERSLAHVPSWSWIREAIKPDTHAKAQ